MQAWAQSVNHLHQRFSKEIHDDYKLNLGPLSLRSVLSFGLQTTSRLEELHKRGFVHCDVGPEHFAYGLGEDANTIFLTNLESGTRFINASGVILDQALSPFMVRTIPRPKLHTEVKLTRGVPSLEAWRIPRYTQDSHAYHGVRKTLKSESLKLFTSALDSLLFAASNPIIHVAALSLK